MTKIKNDIITSTENIFKSSFYVVNDASDPLSRVEEK